MCRASQTAILCKNYQIFAYNQSPMSKTAFQETALASRMSIDEQVTWLMQGTEFGDETLAKTMTRELRARLEESHQRTTTSSMGPFGSVALHGPRTAP
jgi:hypothetical protein